HHQLLVQDRRLVAEEAVRPKCRGEPREAVDRERAGALEVRHQDVLDRSLSVHELVQMDISGIEPEVATRAVVAMRILQHRVRRSVATAEVGPLDVDARRGNERRVIEPVAQDLPDVHPRSLAAYSVGAKGPVAKSNL